MRIRALAFFVPSIFALGCLPLPGATHAPTEIWAVMSPDSIGAPPSRTADSLPPTAATVFSAVADTWIVIDSVSFRPVAPATRVQAPSVSLRFAVVTSFQGSRYHPDVILGLSENANAVALTAKIVASMLDSSGATGLLIDLQQMTADDLRATVDVSRAFADSARGHSAKEIGVMLPATDRAAYPATVLARIADFLVVRLFPEHGLDTPAGPIVSLAWFARRLGARAGEAGVTRLVAGIPADGVLWDSRGGTRRISYADARRLAESAAVPFVREPASGNLHAASSRDGWELWVSDSDLIGKLIAEGRRIGVTRFALFGIAGADPLLFQSLPALVRQ
jgi:hypothetical protein